MKHPAEKKANPRIKIIVSSLITVIVEINPHCDDMVSIIRSNSKYPRNIPIRLPSIPSSKVRTRNEVIIWYGV